MYASLRVLIRSLIGKGRRDALLERKIADLDQLMIKLHLHRNFGFVSPLAHDTRHVLVKDSNGLGLVVPIRSLGTISGVRNDYPRPKPGDVVIDVGAHYGLYSCMCSRLVGNRGLVLSFEPNHTNYQHLLVNMRMNNIHNIKPYEVALGDLNGQTTLYISDDSEGHSVKLKRSNSSTQINIRILDSIVQELKIDHVNIIKVDVEGAELDVLKGASDTLKRFCPILSISAYHYHNELAEVVEWISSHFGFYKIEKTARAIVWCVSTNKDDKKVDSSYAVSQSCRVARLIKDGV